MALPDPNVRVALHVARISCQIPATPGLGGRTRGLREMDVS
jgi:hypothetical protein